MKSLAWASQGDIPLQSHGNQAFHKYPAGFLSLYVSNRQAAVSHQIHIGVIWELIFIRMKNGFECLLISSLRCGMRKLCQVMQWVLKVGSRTSSIQGVHVGAC